MSDSMLIGLSIFCSRSKALVLQPDLSEQLWVVDAIAAHLLVTATVVDSRKPSPLIRNAQIVISVYLLCLPAQVVVDPSGTGADVQLMD
ncbi:hypothetical protein, partial [Paraburkholderia sediminicola]|uniref:hypothetical protein n=1 Tax=Paraburkholderia sediminicola TaxID=458836 RepID=UPI0038BCEF40